MPETNRSGTCRRAPRRSGARARRRRADPPAARRPRRAPGPRPATCPARAARGSHRARVRPSSPAPRAPRRCAPSPIWSSGTGATPPPPPRRDRRGRRSGATGWRATPRAGSVAPRRGPSRRAPTARLRGPRANRPPSSRASHAVSGAWTRVGLPVRTHREQRVDRRLVDSPSSHGHPSRLGSVTTRRRLRLDTQTSAARRADVCGRTGRRPLAITSCRQTERARRPRRTATSGAGARTDGALRSASRGRPRGRPARSTRWRASPRRRATARRPDRDPCARRRACAPWTAGTAGPLAGAASRPSTRSEASTPRLRHRSSVPRQHSLEWVVRGPLLDLAPQQLERRAHPRVQVASEFPR